MNTLTFHNTQLNIINQNNKIWLTSAELAKALSYSDSRSISKIYNQYSDEFTPCMTDVIESVTSGNYRTKYRIFSLRGAHLIAMFARTPIAKDFRKWVLDILDKETNNVVIMPVHPLMEIVEVNKANLECLVHHAKIAREILESNKIYELLDNLGNNTVSQAYHHLKHGLLGASNLHVGVS